MGAKQPGGARPLLLESKRAEETLYLYDHSGWDDDWKWRVSLGHRPRVRVTSPGRRVRFTNRRRPRHGGSTCGGSDTPSRRVPPSSRLTAPIQREPSIDVAAAPRVPSPQRSLRLAIRLAGL